VARAFAGVPFLYFLCGAVFKLQRSVDNRRRQTGIENFSVFLEAILLSSYPSYVSVVVFLINIRYETLF
jgi:hypothetical protein